MQKKMDKEVNHLLIEARKSQHLTQQQVAEKIGASQAFTISRWEHKVNFPNTYYTERLCKLFGKSTKELGLSLSEYKVKSDFLHHLAVHSQDVVVSGRHLPHANPFFTGREEILDTLHKKLSTGNSRAQALTGLGGIGKTQIIVEYIERHREEYQTILWIRAASINTLVTDLRMIADQLQLLPLGDRRKQEKLISAIDQWLKAHQKWLLVLDSADDLQMVHSLLPIVGEKRLTGHIVLTTRTYATDAIADIEVDKMEEEHSVLLLLRRAKILTLDTPLDEAAETDFVQAQIIAQKMDGLPLALDQAGAYIVETQCGLSGYLDRYCAEQNKLLRERGHLVSDHPESVTTTWSLSFKKIKDTNPAAADLLCLLAFLDPDAIPEEIITNGAKQLGPMLSQIATSKITLDKAIRELRKVSFIRRDPLNSSLRIHRLVQAVIKDEMSEKDQQLWAQRAIRAVNAAFPEVTFTNWAYYNRCLSHAQACVELITQYQFTFPEAARLLTYAGWYLRECGLYARAEPFLQQSLKIREQALGSDHPEIATSLDNLALLYQTQGRYTEAEPLYERALKIREQTYGKDDPRTAATLNNLALLYRFKSWYKEAKELLQQALVVREQKCGPEHPDTATTLDNLGLLFWRQGRYSEANKHMLRALTIRKKALGSEHPEIATSLNHLGLLFTDQAQYAKAEKHLKAALTIREKTLGLELPDVAYTINDLGRLCYKKGRYDEAKRHYQRALRIKEQTQAHWHPGTATTLENLALLYHEQGQYDDAKPLYQRALEIRERVLGSQHSRTLSLKEHYERLLDVMEREEKDKLPFRLCEKAQLLPRKRQN